MAHTTATATAQATQPAPTTAQAMPATTLHYRRNHPGGGVLGRCSYGVPGLPGIVVFDLALFASGLPPATLVVQGMQAAQPTARRAAGVTSAVVAQAATTVAQVTATPLASPATVASVAQVQAAQVVAQATAPRLAKPTTGKAHASKVG